MSEATDRAARAIDEINVTGVSLTAKGMAAIIDEEFSKGPEDAALEALTAVVRALEGLDGAIVLLSYDKAFSTAWHKAREVLGE